MVGSPLNPVPMIFVKLDSQGGNIMEALAIGREIRRRFMVTGVPYANMECDSACVFVLMAGVNRIGGGKIGLHRPAFDPAFFADLSPTAARSRYNTLVEQLRQYYVDEMGGSPEAFRIIMTTPSTSIRYLSQDEMLALGIVGEDPAWRSTTKRSSSNATVASGGLLSPPALRIAEISRAVRPRDTVCIPTDEPA